MNTRPDPGDPYDGDDWADLDAADLDAASLDLDDWHLSNGNPTPNQRNEHWWPRLIDRLTLWRLTREPVLPVLREAGRIVPAPALAAFTAALALVATVAALVLWQLLTGLVRLITGITAGIRDTATGAAHTGAHDVTVAGLTRTITEPVHAYLTHHAAGLPIGGTTLWLTWLATTAMLLLLSALGSRGARIGWTLTGAATTAMVYTATNPTARPVAAGLAITLWALLSVIAFNRITGNTTPNLHLSLHGLRRADTDD
ncbi:MAG: hypothetical protein QOH97_2713 [Actinoplanes sp.]|nr:hypothetical protein [Actinoplanes sp.]